MSVLRSFRKALACVAYLVSLQAAAAQQIWLEDAGTLRAVDLAKSSLTATAAIPTAGRFSTDSVGRLWVTDADSLIHLGATGARDVTVSQGSLGLQGVTGLATDPFDGTAWVADSVRLVHVGLDGQVIGGQLLSEALSDLVVAPDQTVWVLGNKNALHYDVATAASGRLIESVALSRLPALPTKLFVDALRKQLWLASGLTLSRVDLANGATRTDIALTASTVGLAFDPSHGWSWMLTGKTLVARDGTGAVTRSIDLPVAAAGAALVAVDPYGQSAWLQVKGGLARVDIASGQITWPKLKFDGQLVIAAASDFLPGTLITPADTSAQGQNASATSLKLALSMFCSGRACSVPPEFVAGLQISGTLNGQVIGSATLDAANQTGTFSLGTSKGTANTGRLIVVATDPFGHASNQLTMQVVGGRIVVASIASQASLSASGGPLSRIPQAKPLDVGNAAEITQALALDSPALVPSSAIRNSGSGVSSGAPLRFEVNEGQHHPAVKFSARSPGFDAFVSADEVLFVVTKADQSAQATVSRLNARLKRASDRRRAALAAPEAVSRADEDGNSQPQSSIVRIQLVGANPTPTVQGLDLLASRSNYLVGNDQSKWRTNVAQYKRAGLHGVYNGIDAIFGGVTGTMEYDFVVAPGADPSVIRQRVAGADSLTQASDGSLLIHTVSGDVRLPPPVLFQPADSTHARRQIAGSFALSGNDEFTFQVGAYDKARTLVIDPTVSYSATVAASASPISAIAADGSGSSYVAGEVNAASFTGGTTTSIGVMKQFYIQKLAANGASVLWTTFIGGSGCPNCFPPEPDLVTDIKVDSAGALYATGTTGASDFPTTSGALETSYTPFNSGDTTSFVLKLSADGSKLTYSTYLGNRFTTGGGIAIDSSGNAYLSGQTADSTFPAVANFPQYGGWFFAKLNPQGTALLYSNVLGFDGGGPIAVDASGNAYSITTTNYFNRFTATYPVGAGNIQPPSDHLGYTVSVVVKIDPTGLNLLGIAEIAGHGHCDMLVTALGLDPTGSPHIGGNATGLCGSQGTGIDPAVMPYTPENDVGTAFVAKLLPDLSAYSNFFFLPGASTSLNSMSIDSDGSAALTGFGHFPGMPAANAITGTPVTEPAGTQWNFAAKLNPPGLGLVYLSAIDAANDLTNVVAVDASKNVYVGGGRVVSKIAATGTLAVALHSSSDIAGASTPVTLTAVVSGGTSPAGTVKFLDGSTTLATVSLTSGAASFTTRTLSLGAHSLTAAYSGDTNNAATSSQLLNQVIVTALTSATTIVATPNPVRTGAQVTITATVTPSGTATTAPVGSVTLYEGTTVLGTCVITACGTPAGYGGAGVQFSLSNLTAGTHKITATFSGNKEVAASTSAALSLVVFVPTLPTVALSVTPQQAIYTPIANYSVVVTPTVTTPGATVSSVTLQAAKVTSTSATFNTVGTLTAPPYTFAQQMSEGVYRYVARVTDSSGNTGSSATLQTLVHAGPTASWGTPTAGSTLTSPTDARLTGGVTLSNPIPGANSSVDVEFFEGLVSTPGLIDPGAMGNSASFTATYPSIPAGSHTMRAYAKDQYGLASYSAPVTFKVAQPAGTIPFVAAWSGIGSGQTVAATKFSLTVKALSHNAGTIFTFQLYENGSLIQRFQGNFLGTPGGTPGVLDSFPITTTVGPHTYVAIVSDQTGTSSSTGPVTVNVSAGAAGPTVGIDSPINGTQFAANSTITLAATAWPGSSPISRMDYYSGSTLLQSVPDGGTALTWPNVPAGVYTITVVATDTANLSTRSAPVTFYVGNAPFGAITSPADGSVFTAPATVTLTASATTASTATISHVDYYRAGTLVGTSTTAPYTFSATGLAAGFYQYTAKIFDSAGNTSTSAPVTVQVATLAASGSTTTTTTYLLSDIAGSPIAATDASGNVLWRESYKPFGDRTVNAKTAKANRQFFHGKAADPESGLSYFGARYYDPVIGRFMAPDPAGFQEGDIQSFGRYAYGDNNPYRYRDPDGHSPIDLIFLAVDVAKLGYAVYKGEGVGSALIDVGMSAAGVLIPIPGAGQAMKAARAIEHTAEAVRGAEHSAEAVAKLARSCGCFVAGTPVATQSGTIPIEKVSVGMLVMARDEATGETALRPVRQIFHYEGREIYGVVLLDEKGKISRLEVTDDHPFKVPGQGWILSRDLRPGTLLESLGRSGLKVVHIQDLGRTQPTFNFEVADSHTFFVGEAGVLVHNTGLCDITARGGTYVLKDGEGVVVKTGRTNDLARREAEHGRAHPDKSFEVDKRTDSRMAQRGREQDLHDANPSAHKANGGLDKINGISPNNPMRDKYLEAGRALP